ncbi:hypothetical protein [Aurantimonas sp. VKM B-3413]|uniref:hypothetical protein n=1 Tax=Aurantimonas sp. VKM B-3413 TaxID=2779401 RepID=UPI001E35C478|nr:hypothetical protein [Aurantimonas sp. VKM B-3413]MCB8836786.1 hypothetical protein [Aurantimonas sp. VKM B-3413]
MSCCAQNACVFPDEGPHLGSRAEQEILLARRIVSDGVRQVTLSALAMSGSSLLVMANSLRPGRYRFRSEFVEGERQVRRSGRTVQAIS